MGLLNFALGGLGGMSGGMQAGLLPFLAQNGGGKGGDPSPQVSPLLKILQSPQFQNGVSMMATGEPPSMPGFAGAFSGNPQFQQQLAQIMGGNGPGSQPVQYRPPASPVSLGPQQQQRPLGGGFGAPGFDNFGMSALEAARRRMRGY